MYYFRRLTKFGFRTALNKSFVRIMRHCRMNRAVLGIVSSKVFWNMLLFVLTRV
jgi:hypothetical protein